MAGPDYDVIVVGAGNAGLSAALAAEQMGTKVLLLDKCPKVTRGGNTLFGRRFRFTYNSPQTTGPCCPTFRRRASRLSRSYSPSDFRRRGAGLGTRRTRGANLLVDQSIRLHAGSRK
jgi:tricarballylate dehydrogenase